jgi:hypothetical protein
MGVVMYALGGHMDISLVADGEAGGALIGGIFSLLFLFIALGVLTTLFWLWMLIDVLTSPMEDSEKILWFLVVFMLHFLGALIYFLVRRRQRAAGVAPR